MEKCIDCWSWLTCIETKEGRQIQIKNTIYNTTRTIWQCKVEILEDYIRNTLIPRLSNIIELNRN